ncbi:MAG: histidine kinase N-terminal 7TM domain-containing protein [Bacillota bacterium]
MNYQFSPSVIPHFISLIILCFLGGYSYRHKNVRGALSFTACVGVCCLWVLCYMFGITAVDEQTKFFWSNLQYFSFAFLPVLWLVMVLRFINKQWLTKKKIMLLFIIPSITAVLAWTDKTYGLLRRDFSLNPSGIYPLTTEFGTWFTVHYSYSYLLLFTAVVLLINTVWKKNSTFRRQAAFLLTGFAILLITDILSVAGILPWERIFVDPIVFNIASLILGAGIFYLHIFDIVPVARETIIEKLDSGIMVLDNKKRIIDINQQLKNMFGPKVIKVGDLLSGVMPDLADYISRRLEGMPKKEFSLKQQNGETNYYEVYISSIKDTDQDLATWVLIINNITDLKQARNKIKEQIETIAVMDERVRLARELHDNLGQVLSFADLQTQAICREIEEEKLAVAQQYSARLNKIIKKTHKEMREYVYNIRDGIKYNKDFIVLLQKEIDLVKENDFFELELKFSDEIDLSYLGIEEKMHLLFIIKEALTNVLKYAQADNVVVEIKENDSYLEIVVEDDGQGIVTVSDDSGSGLNIMKERTMLISGEIAIESEAGVGTKITITLPIKSGVMTDGNNDC